MSGLFDSLTSAARALDAQRMGLDVVGQNMANINTPGYARRRLLLAEMPPTDPTNAGRGVEVVGIQAQRDMFIENRLRQEQQGASFSNAQLQNLMYLQAGIGLPGGGLDGSLNKLFDAFSAFAADVTSVPVRDSVVAQGRTVAQTFNTLAQRITAARVDADGNIRAAVDEINNLAAQVAALNGRITNANNVDIETLRDQRNVALSRLAELAGVNVAETNDGSVTVSIGPGSPLVVGATAFQLDMSPSTPSAMGTLSIGGANITSQLNAGTIGGLLQLRDTVLPGYMGRLDQMAFDIATGINAVHSAGFDATGNAAGDFFVQPGAVAGAAAAMAVDPALAANSLLLAGSSTGAAGDNQTAQALAALRDSPIMLGGSATPADAWGQFVYQIGADITAAQSQSDTHDQVVLQLQRLRDSASGVSLDEEAAWLMKYQRAYEANARFFTTVNSAIDTLMQMVM